MCRPDFWLAQKDWTKAGDSEGQCSHDEREVIVGGMAWEEFKRVPWQLSTSMPEGNLSAYFVWVCVWEREGEGERERERDD